MLDPRLPYVVVLAGGQGNRLAPLTRALYGTDLPKQFAVLAGEQSLLQTTIERAAALTSLDRILVVVTAHHEPIARTQLEPYPGVELIVQPASLDTGPGMLLPLARLLARDWTARVVFLPSDHYVSNPAAIIQALQDTRRAALQDHLALIGVAPTGPEIEYGWIVRGAAIARSSAFQVDRFAEKPTAPLAEELWRSGALWNTFITTGSVRTYWDLARRHLPAHVEALERYVVAIGGLNESEALAAAYRAMTVANFSRDVLSHAKRLAVVPVAGSGWSDWGSPARVFASLEGTDNHARLLERIVEDRLTA